MPPVTLGIHGLAPGDEAQDDAASSGAHTLFRASVRGAAAWLRSMPSSYHTKAPNLHMRVMLQYWLGTIIPVLAIALRECDCHWLRERGPDGGPGLADLRGRHDMVCTNTSGDKLRRHNSVLVAIRASSAHTTPAGTTGQCRCAGAFDACGARRGRGSGA